MVPPFRPKSRGREMKPILLALVVGVACLVLVTITLRYRRGTPSALALVANYAALLPVLVGLELLTPPDLGFLPAGYVFASLPWEVAFAVFLLTAGFFGGVLQLYNLAERGLSLRILIDIAESTAGRLTLDQVMSDYGGGQGIAWMYDKRIAGLLQTGLVERKDTALSLTPRGRRFAIAFGAMRTALRLDEPRAER
jgi:hypothetical protein